VWDGTLEFQNLEHEVFEELPKRVWDEDPPPRTNLYVGWALCFHNGNWEEGVLRPSIPYKDHLETIRHRAESLAAVSYDVAFGENEPPADALDYGLTVEDLRSSRRETSSDYADMGGFELSLQLPKNRAWTAGLIEWVIEHHAWRRALQNAMDFEDAARVFSNAEWRGSDGSPLQTERGSTRISDGVVSKIAGIAAQEVDGIRMGSGGSQTQDVSVEVGQEEAALDLTLTAEYGKPVPQLVEAVRRNVINRVESLVGLRVTEVNVTVSNVFFPQQKAEEQRQRELGQQRREQEAQQQQRAR
jgi:uncharacterized alkaline shock family protein YloU